MSDQTCTLSSEHLSLAVAPLGAEMQYLRTASGQELLWHGDKAFWTGRAPILFPIVGRAVDDVVRSGNLTAEMAKHGFARRRTFAVEEASQTRCRHVLHASEATRAVYPFEFTQTVTHELDGPTLSVTAEVANAGDAPMPFGFGFHPAFRCPLPGTDAPHSVTLASGGEPQQQPLRPDGLLERALVPGPFREGCLEITDTLFENDALVFPGASEPVRYGPANGPWLDFAFSNLPDLALWRPVGAPFLCVEPWHGTASLVGDGPEIAQRPNSLTLAPDAVATFGYRVTFVFV
ncbi:MAG: aldose 1-epimerase family protein [Pseudomonadota bacterium]